MTIFRDELHLLHIVAGSTAVRRKKKPLQSLKMKIATYTKKNKLDKEHKMKIATHTKKNKLDKD